MVKNLLLFLFAFLSQPLFSQETKPLEAHQPFSNDELSVIKERGIRKVLHAQPAEGMETCYYFDSTGKLTRSEYRKTTKRKRKKVKSSKRYEYNQNGQRTVVDCDFGYQLYDTLAYDSTGSIIYMMSFRSYPKGERELRYEYKLHNVLDDTYYLIDSTDSNVFYCVIENNEIVKTYSDGYLDSIAILRIDSNDWIEQRWLLQSDSLTLMLKEEVYYKNGKIQKKLLYRSNSGNFPWNGPSTWRKGNYIDSTCYYYDENGNLYNIDKGQYEKIFYTYNYYGLKELEIRAYGRKVRIRMFYYHRR